MPSVNKLSLSSALKTNAFADFFYNTGRLFYRVPQLSWMISTDAEFLGDKASVLMDAIKDTLCRRVS
jgi:hypothetical protein